MSMSAKTPGLNTDRMTYKPGILRGHHLAVYPPLLVNIGDRASSTDYADDNYESSVIFSPEGAMFLTIDPSNTVQSSASSTQEQSLPTSLSAIAASSLELQLASLGSGASTDSLDQPSTMPLSMTSASSIDALATAAPSIASSQISNPSSSTSQAQLESESQAQAGFVATPSSTATSSATSSATTPTTSSAALPSLTTSQAVSSPSATSTLQRDSENLPRVAEVVIGVVGAISLIAFLATLGSWIYKQHHRKNEHAEIISITSFNDAPHRGFFGCLPHRRSKATDDMSELGFGLGRVAFFSDPNSGIEGRHVGLTPDAENRIRGEKKDTNGSDGACLPPQNPFADHFGDLSVDRRLSMVRPLPPSHLQNNTAMNIASSGSVFPYQHLASANALGGLSVIPLTVANFVPGDTSSDEGKHSSVLPSPSCVMRQPSVGTPRIGVSIPRFMNLVDDDALAVPWAPLDMRRNELRALHEKQDLKDLGDEEEAREQDTGHGPLQISRTATLTLAVSRTFSRRLGHSLSKASDWRNGVTKPPPGTFQAAWDAHNKPDGAAVSTGTENHWATTLKNNFFSAWNAVGSSMHVNNTSNRNVDPNNIPTNPGQVESVNDLLEDILTPPPVRVATLRLERTKGSIIRSKLTIGAGSGAGHGTELGVDLSSLSRSSTLSTCWTDSEEPNVDMVRKTRMRVWALSHTGRLVQRSGTSSTAASMTRLAPRDSRHSGRERPGLSANGKHMKPPSKRPRFSRLPMSQSSVWSSTSYASTDRGEERC